MEPFSSLQFHLDNQGKSQILKLATWSKILGYVNIILGGFNAAVSLPNFLMGNELQITVIPSVMAAGVLIYMGLQLTGASANLRSASINENDQAFANALEQIRRFFFLSVMVYLVGLILLVSLMASFTATGTEMENVVKDGSSGIPI